MPRRQKEIALVIHPPEDEASRREICRALSEEYSQAVAEELAQTGATADDNARAVREISKAMPQKAGR